MPRQITFSMIMAISLCYCAFAEAVRYAPPAELTVERLVSLPWDCELDAAAGKSLIGLADRGLDGLVIRIPEPVLINALQKDSVEWSRLLTVAQFCRDSGIVWIPLIEVESAAAPAWDEAQRGTLRDALDALDELYFGNSGKRLMVEYGAHTAAPNSHHDETDPPDLPRFLRRRYSSIATLNAVWGTDFKSWAAFSAPGAQARNPVAANDVADYRRDISLRRMDDLLDLVRHTLPDAAILVRPQGDVPLTRAVRIALKRGAEVQFCSHASSYGEMVARTREGITASRSTRVRRSLAVAGCFDDQALQAALYLAVSSGIGALTLESTDWLADRKTAIAWQDLADPPPSSCRPIERVAVLQMHEEPEFIDRASALRDVTDYDILDEYAVIHGALRNYRALVLLNGGTLQRATLRKIESFVKKGGFVFHAAFDGPLTDLQGSSALYDTLFKTDGAFSSGEPGSVSMNRRRAAEILGQGYRRHQGGGTAAFPDGQGGLAGFCEFIRLCLFGHVRLADFIPLEDPGDEFTNLYWTRCPEAGIVYFNESEANREVLIRPGGRSRAVTIPSGGTAEARY